MTAHRVAIELRGKHPLMPGDWVAVCDDCGWEEAVDASPKAQDHRGDAAREAQRLAIEHQGGEYHEVERRRVRYTPTPDDPFPTAEMFPR